MTKKYNKSIFVFRRDLRLYDNTALISALCESEQVFLVFIFDPRQIESHSFKSVPAFKFMLESLEDLDFEVKSKGGRLNYFLGTAEDAIGELIKKTAAQAVFLNADYTPFSRERDSKIRINCQRLNCAFHSFDDVLINPPTKILKTDKKPYTIYTPFYKAAAKFEVPKPVAAIFAGFSSDFVGNIEIADIKERFQNELKINNLINGGRKNALKILEKLSAFSLYEQQRNFPAISGTTLLSAHNKFGTVSIREVYWQIKNSLPGQETLLKELYWRDFFTQIAFHFPNIFKESFNPKYRKITWENDSEKMLCWQQGLTGFPIVDAGMRELNSTGFMHNRVRMIVASFLCKDLQIDWRLGEQYFAQKLIDYDPAVNNGNWQWAASTGCDAQPYFRIFNPWLQQEKFDKDAVYIKKWVPEITNFSAKEIHSEDFLNSTPAKDYPKPLLSHAEAKLATLDMYAQSFK